MTDYILLDNDVVLKVCAYQCHDELLSVIRQCRASPTLLSIAKFAIRSRLSRRSRIINSKAALHAFEHFLSAATFIEPCEVEIELAADLEERAIALGLEFDTGESQLVAILILRSLSSLITGDKRAIIALHGIAVAGVEGRIVCLEQLFTLILTILSCDTLRRRICIEPDADKALTACFACSVEQLSQEDALTSLLSYANHLRRQTGSVLIEESALLSIIS